MNRARFVRKGALALAASAWGQEYELIAPPQPTLDGGVAVVMVMGPLTHHGDWWGGDTYDAIEARVRAALETSASTVVMKLDSPGGEVNGAFECSKTLRSMARAAGKKLIAYVDEFAASAAYALACAADAIYLPEAGQLGSIGVIDCVFDDTAYNAREGYQIAVITSGKQKADGNPNVPLTDEIRARIQANVDGLAQLFFALVADTRGIDSATVQAFEAGMFRGQEAVNAKLADGVMSWDALLAMVASGQVLSAAEPEAAESGEGNAAMKYAELLAAIKAAMAEDAPAPEKKDGEEQEMTAAEFKAALKGLFAEDAPPPAPHTEPDGDEGKEPAKPSDKDGDEEKAKAQAAHQAQAEAEQMANEARLALLDSRPDLSATERKELEAKPLAVVREVLRFRPRPAAASAPVPPPAAAAQVPGTRGDNQGDKPKSDNPTMDRLMGLRAEAPQVHWDGVSRVFPAMTPEQAREASKNGGVR